VVRIRWVLGRGQLQLRRGEQRLEAWVQGLVLGVADQQRRSRDEIRLGDGLVPPIDADRAFGVEAKTHASQD
jgi:hypothetical protein